MGVALRAVWENKVVWTIHIFANAALLAAIYGWLWIPDRTVLDVILSVIAGLSILVLASWLHAGTLQYFQASHETGDANVRASFRPALGRICAFGLWLLVLGAAIVLVLQLKNHITPLANWIASALTFRLQRPVRPDTVSAVLSAFVAIAAFAAIPFLLLQIWKWKWGGKYILTYGVLLLAGAYLPYRLIWWVPKFNGIYAQAASMAFRFAAAYLLAVTGWLVLISTLGLARSGREVEIRR